MPPSEPVGEVLDKYTDTLCNTQKKTSLESSLLQDIPMLNGNDSSQLENWLTDIETASELMGESRTKLAQAKSRGLVRTLILKALTSQKLGRKLRTLSTYKYATQTSTHPSATLWIFNKKKRNP